MINIAKLSKTYVVRKMEDADAESILHLCLGNAQFYRYCAAKPTMEQVLNDLHITPPEIPMSDKYYVGFYEDKTLAAVMDLIDGYPDADIAFIGFFMMDHRYQGKQIGSAIIDEVSDYLRSIGKRAVRLGIDEGNPQSTHFWKKNGFAVIAEKDVNGWTKLVAEKIL
ncbi:MAG: GNAT family N-acetyltransferase [Erysipelotrichaceae bacterium]|nr:GNAT family N-acetyltransferase [Erysipelotrichaceae bacterium]